MTTSISPDSPQIIVMVGAPLVCIGLVAVLAWWTDRRAKDVLDQDDIEDAIHLLVAIAGEKK